MLSEAIRAEPFQSALHPRTIGRAGAIEMPSWRLVHLQRGHAEIQAGADVFALEAPCVALVPWRDELRLRIPAGAVGAHVLLGAAIINNAIGPVPEAADLRLLAERRAHLRLEGKTGQREAVEDIMRGILREATSEGPAARSAVEALLRVLLIQLWRGQGAPHEDELPSARGGRLFAQFTNLMEVHFRERWTVGRYAEVLGISRDRLTDICRRSRDRTPGDMIVERTMAEARQLLANSAHPLDHVAGMLGFHSTAHFGRYFRSYEGVPPGRFRNMQREGRPEVPQESTAPLFEWP